MGNQRQSNLLNNVWVMKQLNTIFIVETLVALSCMGEPREDLVEAYWAKNSIYLSANTGDE
jgi:hypothetical protein